MKKLFISTLIISFGMSGTAQEEGEKKKDEKTQYLTGTDAVTSGFGGPFFEVSTIGSNTVAFAGGGGGGLFNQRFYFGGFGFGLASDVTMENQAFGQNGLPAQGNIDLGMGGFMFGYIFYPKKAVHPLVGADFAWGGLEVTDPTTGVELLSDNISTITPKLGIELNVAPWFKINGVAGYRIYSGVTSNFFSGTEFNSPLFQLQLHFGWFGDWNEGQDED